MGNSTSRTSDRVIDHNCAWVRGVHRCQMPGTVSYQTGPGAKYYCMWHLKALQCPQTVDNAEIFNSFVEQQINTMIARSFEEHGLPPPKNPWNEDIRTLRRKVGISG